MDFSTLFNDIQTVFQFMLAEFRLFFQKISSYQLIIFALLVLVAFPSLFVIFDLISFVAYSSDDSVSNSRLWYKKIYKRREVTESKKIRENFNSVKHIDDYSKAYRMSKDFFKEYPYRSFVKIKGFKFSNEKVKPKYRGYSISSNNNISSSGSFSSRKNEKSNSKQEENINKDDEE